MKKKLFIFIFIFIFIFVSNLQNIFSQEKPFASQTKKEPYSDSAITDQKNKSEILGVEPHGFLYDHSLKEPIQPEKKESLNIIILKTEIPAKQPVINHYHYNYYYNQNPKEEKHPIEKKSKKESKVNEDELKNILTESATQKSMETRKEIPERKKPSGLDVIREYKSDRKKRKEMLMEKKTNLHKLKQNQLQGIFTGNNNGITSTQPIKNTNIPFNNPYKQEKPGNLDHPHTDFFKNNNPYPYEIKDKKKKYYHYSDSDKIQ